MSSMRREPNEKFRRLLVVAGVLPLLLVGVTSCGGTEDSPEVQTNAQNDEHEVTGEEVPEQDDAGHDLEEGTEEMDSGALLEAGLLGEAIIRCDFANDTVSGVIYFDLPDRARFDSVAADGGKAHILLYQGRAHAWKEGQSEGARYPEDGTTYLVADDAAAVEASSTNCVRYTGSSSIFDLPSDVAFADVQTK